MKFLLSILILSFVYINGFTQAPNRMSYQTVIRDASGLLVKSKNIGIQISILKGSSTGVPVYVERHFPATNINGLATIEVGGGIVISGNITSIDWALGLYFIKSETDLNGGSNYTISNTSQLLSVPYALHAKTCDGFANKSKPMASKIIAYKGGDSVRVKSLISNYDTTFYVQPPSGADKQQSHIKTDGTYIYLHGSKEIIRVDINGANRIVMLKTTFPEFFDFTLDY